MIIHKYGNGHVYRRPQRLLFALWLLLLPTALLANTDQEYHISIVCRDQPLKWILSQFERQSGLSFVYSNDDLDVNRKYSVAVKKMKLNDALYKIFSPLKLRFEISGDKILLRAVAPPSTTATGSSGSVRDTSVTIKGKVLDEKGNPLAGVSVD